MSSPLVSILIPCYNGTRYLPELCESILAQTFTDFEVLIGDDNSTDNTLDVLKPFLRDPRFKLFAWNTNRGLHHNIVLLLNLARGQFWCPPGQDDVLSPMFLERRVALLERRPDVSLVHGAAEFIDERGRPYISDAISRGLPELARRLPETITGEAMLPVLLQHNILNWPSTLVRMDLTRQVLPYFTPRWIWAMDWMLWILMAATGYDFLWDSQPMIKYRVHSDSISVSSHREAIRKAERKIVPLVALRTAANFSPIAKSIWMKQRHALYRWWLATAAASKWRGTLVPGDLLVAAEAYKGFPPLCVNLWRELAVRGLPAAWQYLRERRANGRQLFRVSGLSLIDHPYFKA